MEQESTKTKYTAAFIGITLSGEGDYFTANNLLQIALFGEEIYG